MILCARSTSRSREQSTKRISRSENMWKVCLFYSQNNKIVWLSNMALTWEIHEVFLIVLFGCWLAGQVNSNHMAGITMEKLIHFVVLVFLKNALNIEYVILFSVNKFVENLPPPVFSLTLTFFFVLCSFFFAFPSASKDLTIITSYLPTTRLCPSHQASCRTTEERKTSWSREFPRSVHLFQWYRGIYWAFCWQQPTTGTHAL